MENNIPIGDKVMIKLEKIINKAGNILLPDTKLEQSLCGKIVKFGTTFKNTIDLNIGDKVCLNYTMDNITIGSKTDRYVIAHTRDILYKIEE